jgi:hypothetical protein
MVFHFFSTNRIMDGSRVTENIDSLWYYTNIFTSFTHEPAELSLTQPLISSSIQPKTELQKPNASIFLLNQQCESAMSSSLELEEELVRKSERETEKKKDRRMRRRKKKHEIVQMVAAKSKQQLSEMPPFNDDVAMKQHLKSWAYAVASHAISHFQGSLNEVLSTLTSTHFLSISHFFITNSLCGRDITVSLLHYY